MHRFRLLQEPIQPTAREAVFMQHVFKAAVLLVNAFIVRELSAFDQSYEKVTLARVKSSEEID